MADPHTQGQSTQLENGKWIVVWNGETVTDDIGDLVEFDSQADAEAYMRAQNTQ